MSKNDFHRQQQLVKGRLLLLSCVVQHRRHQIELTIIHHHHHRQLQWLRKIDTLSQILMGNQSRLSVNKTEKGLAKVYKLMTKCEEITQRSYVNWKKNKKQVEYSTFVGKGWKRNNTGKQQQTSARQKSQAQWLKSVRREQDENIAKAKDQSKASKIPHSQSSSKHLGQSLPVVLVVSMRIFPGSNHL